MPFSIKQSCTKHKFILRLNNEIFKLNPLKVLFIDNYLNKNQFEELCDPFQMHMCQKSCSGENLCKKVASEQLF